MSMVVVLKPFVSNGEDFVRDQLEDGGKFRNLQVLLTQRYLRLASTSEIESAVTEGDDDEDVEDESEVEEEVVDTDDEEEEEEPRPKKVKKLKSVGKNKVAKKTGLKARAKARRR